MNGFIIAAAVTLAALTGTTRAGDPSNVAGAWEFTKGGVLEQQRATTVELRLQGKSLSGNVSWKDGRKTPIVSGTYRDGEFSFEVVSRRLLGWTETLYFEGRVVGDTLAGSAKTRLSRRVQRKGEPRGRSWQTVTSDWGNRQSWSAKRATLPPSVPPNSATKVTTRTGAP